MLEIPKWLEDALQTAQFHRFHKLSSAKKWTLKDTAKALRRSLGPISEDIMIAKWHKTHDMSQFKYAYEAINFIKMKKKEMELEE